MRVGIIKERKIPVDHRVAFSPKQCKDIQERYPHVQMVVEPSDIRCFDDDDYRKNGIEVSSDLHSCELLFGVKEVPIDQLIPDKRYFFFSHTIKKQSYNRELLRAVLDKNISLVDYECLKDVHEKRVVAFGRFAGIVGAYNGILTFGKKLGLFDLKPANQCFDMDELWDEFEKVELPPIKILLTGGGRVARGAQEVLDDMGIRNVVGLEYLNQTFKEPVYIQLDSDAYNQRMDRADFDFSHFYNNPNMYESTFDQYTDITDVLIAGAYWDPGAPALFTLEDVQSPDFRIRTVADITCDIKGSIPTTVRSTTINEPCYDFSRKTLSEVEAFSDLDNITVMAVDNLPCELPRDASVSFGEQLLENVTDALFTSTSDTIVDRATIAKGGVLTERYSYLQDYVN